MKTKINSTCKDCGVELSDVNWYHSYQKEHQYICKNCHNKRNQQWQKANPDKLKDIWTRSNRKRGHHPYNKNKACSQYLGIHVAERVLSHVFKNAQRMPMNNHGYDFICGKGYKIDVKSSCLQKSGRWLFTTNNNTIADYFLCIAFDNREDLNPLYTWLIAGSKLNHLKSASISPSTTKKWDEYKLDVETVVTCCNVIKAST